MNRITSLVLAVLLLAALPGCKYGTTISFGEDGIDIYPTDPRGEGPFRNHPQILSANKIYD